MLAKVQKIPSNTDPRICNITVPTMTKWERLGESSMTILVDRSNSIIKIDLHRKDRSSGEWMDLPLGTPRSSGLLSILSQKTKLGHFRSPENSQGEQVTALFDNRTNAWFVTSEVRMKDSKSKFTTYHHIRINSDGSINYESTSCSKPSKSLQMANSKSSNCRGYSTIPAVTRQADISTSASRTVISVNLTRGCIWIDMPADSAGLFAGTMELPLGRDCKSLVLGNPSNWTQTPDWEQALARFDKKSGSWLVRVQTIMTPKFGEWKEINWHLRIDRYGRITKEISFSNSPSSQLMK